MAIKKKQEQVDGGFFSATKEAMERKKAVKKQRQGRVHRMREQVKREVEVNQMLTALQKISNLLLQCDEVDSIDIYVDSDQKMNDLIGVLEAGKLFYAYEIYGSVVRLKNS